MAFSCRRRLGAGRQRRSAIRRQGDGGAQGRGTPRCAKSRRSSTPTITSIRPATTKCSRRRGAKIIAHERTRQWMSTDYWVPAEDRYEKARPKAARPTETFQTTGSLKAGDRTDRLRLPASGPHQRRHLRLLQRLRMFWRSATWHRRCAIRRSIISPERGSAAAWTRWISCSSSAMNRPGSCPRTVPS